jgi:hypothetical protein
MGHRERSYAVKLAVEDPVIKKLFGRKGAKNRAHREALAATTDAPTALHRVTVELKRAETFATMLATSRRSRVIEVADLLAGMYVCNWDRLSGYWGGEDQEAIENFLQGFCRVSPQRWHAWIELYDRGRREQEPSGWSLRQLVKKKTPGEKPLRPSAALHAVFQQARQIAPSYDRVGGRSIPILTSECVLLCIVRNLGSDVGKKLVGTGLDADRLQYDALFPRRAPLGGSAAKES